MHRFREIGRRRLVPWVLIPFALAGAPGAASPPIAAGDVALRQDIQLLADSGILSGPVTTWPLAWQPILADLDRARPELAGSSVVALAADRVRERAERETRPGALRYRAGVAAAEAPLTWRSFADTPRDSGEVTAGVSWMSERLSLELHGQVVRTADDDRKLRADGSRIALVLGNYSIAASSLERWWGPGWDGSLILSNNARPIPALTFDRIVTEPFESRWLRWLGPWDVAVVAGRMESDRAVPGTRLLGFRFNFRPLQSLEIGLSRTAQWCGEGRPCDLDSFVDLILGRDNRGDAGIGTSNEPGNQLAGVDVRFSLARLGMPVAVYGQFVGEDEAGGLPSKFLGQAGIEANGVWRERWTWRQFFELASTKCRFYRSDVDYDCAYNHGIYRTGYRYRGRAVGHGSDNDALMFSTGLMLADRADTRWQLLMRYGELNRGGAPDPRNGLTPTRQELASLDMMHGRTFRYGVIEIGAGLERVDDAASGEVDTDVRAFLQWRSAR